MSKNTLKLLRPMKAAMTSSRLQATKIASMSHDGSPRQNTKQVNISSSAANTYLNHAGGIRTALPASSASTASAWTSTPGMVAARSEEHTSELQSIMRISYDVFCLKQKSRTDSTRLTT